LDGDIIDSHRNLRATEEEFGSAIKLNYKAHFGTEESVSAGRKHRATHEEMRTPSAEFYKLRRSDGYQQDRRLDEIERERELEERK